MNEFLDAVELFIGVVNGLKKKQINLSSSLDEIVLKACGTNLAYVDNRRNAKEEFNFDFWDSIKKQFRNSESFLNWIKSYSIDERFLYSKSEQFPDFLLKVKKHDNKLICGSLLELKDSKGGSIASFNSTLPTKYKSLDEADIIIGHKRIINPFGPINGATLLYANHDGHPEAIDPYYLAAQTCIRERLNDQRD